MIQYSITLKVHQINNSQSIFYRSHESDYGLFRIQCIDLFFSQWRFFLSHEVMQLWNKRQREENIEPDVCNEILRPRKQEEAPREWWEFSLLLLHSTRHNCVKQQMIWARAKVITNKGRWFRQPRKQKNKKNRNNSIHSDGGLANKQLFVEPQHLERERKYLFVVKKTSMKTLDKSLETLLHAIHFNSAPE